MGFEYCLLPIIVRAIEVHTQYTEVETIRLQFELCRLDEQKIEQLCKDLVWFLIMDESKEDDNQMEKIYENVIKKYLEP